MKNTATAGTLARNGKCAASDKELLTLATTGDASAFNELATRHRTAMLYAAQSVVRSVEDAEDCVQDTLLALWRDCLTQCEEIAAMVCPLGLLRFRVRQAALRFLARRQALKRGGKDRHAFDEEVRRSLYQLLAHKHAGSVVERQATPEPDVAFKRLGMVQRLAPQLPPALLGPLNAYFSHGESLQSMAERRGCNADDVKRTLSAGLQTLRYLVAKDPENAELAA
jgi:RNA polymerase sigma factor (sigma-70 family)